MRQLVAIPSELRRHEVGEFAVSWFHRPSILWGSDGLVVGKGQDVLRAGRGVGLPVRNARAGTDSSDGVSEVVRGGRGNDYAKVDTASGDSSERDRLRSVEHPGDACASRPTPETDCWTRAIPWRPAVCGCSKSLASLSDMTEPKREERGRLRRGRSAVSSSSKRPPSGTVPRKSRHLTGNASVLG